MGGNSAYLTEGNVVAALAIAAGVALLVCFRLCGGIFTRKFEYLLYEVTQTARNCTPGDTNGEKLYSGVQFLSPHTKNVRAQARQGTKARTIPPSA